MFAVQMSVNGSEPIVGEKRFVTFKQAQMWMVKGTQDFYRSMLNTHGPGRVEYERKDKETNLKSRYIKVNDEDTFLFEIIEVNNG